MIIKNIYDKVEFFRTYTTKSSVIDMYKMKIISLLISLFDIIKTKALECVSVVN